MTRDDSPRTSKAPVSDRPKRPERRTRKIPVALDRRKGETFPGERRSPVADEERYSPEDLGFMEAMDQYKRDNRRPFPTWSEVLEVLRALGYRKSAEAVAPPPPPSEERRRGPDRREKSIPVAVERRKGERRRQVDPTTCERDYTDEEIIFMRAMDQYKRDNRRPFPTLGEVLGVLKSLGYRKVAEATALPGNCSAPPPKG